jgi:hypothetical protein
MKRTEMEGTNQCVYEESCVCRNNYQRNKQWNAKHWIKAVSGVDLTKEGGYAVLGSFLSAPTSPYAGTEGNTVEHLVPTNSLVVSVGCGQTIVSYMDPSGTQRAVLKRRSSHALSGRVLLSISKMLAMIADTDLALMYLADNTEDVTAFAELILRSHADDAEGQQGQTHRKRGIQTRSNKVYSAPDTSHNTLLFEAVAYSDDRSSRL